MTPYSFILDRAKLSEEHKKKLITERGFTEETITKCRFVSGGKYLLEKEQELKSSFPQDILLSSGVCISDGKGLQINPMLTEDRIIIPYLDKQGFPVYLRPHKLGFAGVPLEIYQETNLTGQSIILTLRRPLQCSWDSQR
jgi:hypothetical protein